MRFYIFQPDIPGGSVKCKNADGILHQNLVVYQTNQDDARKLWNTIFLQSAKSASYFTRKMVKNSDSIFDRDDSDNLTLHMKEGAQSLEWIGMDCTYCK